MLRELRRVVRPGGRIVLADFSAEGFEMVARVHASEGGTHPEGPVTMDWTRGFLGGLDMTEVKLGGDRFHRIAVFQAPPGVPAPPAFASLDRAGLFTALDTFAKSWLAHDGCWFLAAEEKYGLDTAMLLDAVSWERFAPIEAERIKSGFGIPDRGGLPALEQALKLRMYALANRQEPGRHGGASHQPRSL